MAYRGRLRRHLLTTCKLKCLFICVTLIEMAVPWGLRDTTFYGHNYPPSPDSIYIPGAVQVF